MSLGRSAVVIAVIAFSFGCGSSAPASRMSPAVPGENPTGYMKGGFVLDPTLRHEDERARDVNPQRELDQQRMIEEAERERRELEQQRQFDQQQRDMDRANGGFGPNDPDRCMSCR